MKIIAGIVGALALTTAAQGATYDAFSSFNGVQGAGGFIYLKLPLPGGSATQLTSSSNCIVTADFCLQDGGSLPGVYKSLTSFSESTYQVPDDRLLVHPGAANPLGVFFVAPTAGDYDFSATFNILDRAPTGVALIGLTNLGGVVSTQLLGVINGQNPFLSRSGNITLAQGDSIGVIIANGGNYSNDSTGVNFTLTRASVPEPASWALMILGFGAAGAVLRRRRAPVAECLPLEPGPRCA